MPLGQPCLIDFLESIKASVGQYFRCAVYLTWLQLRWCYLMYYSAAKVIQRHSDNFDKVSVKTKISVTVTTRGTTALICIR